MSYRNKSIRNIFEEISNINFHENINLLVQRPLLKTPLLFCRSKFLIETFFSRSFRRTRFYRLYYRYQLHVIIKTFKNIEYRESAVISRPIAQRRGVPAVKSTELKILSRSCQIYQADREHDRETNSLRRVTSRTDERNMPTP